MVAQLSCPASIRVAQVAEFVEGGAKEFVANAEIERQVFADSIIILCEPGAGGDAVVVVAYATSRLAEERGSGQETLKVGAKSGDSVGKEQQSIVGHRKIAADGSAVNFTAEAELVRAVRSEGTRVVLITHDLGQLRRLADEVVFLHHGRIFERTPARAFLTQPTTDEAQAFLRGEIVLYNEIAPEALASVQ